jgi:hypothetical protein
VDRTQDSFLVPESYFNNLPNFALTFKFELRMRVDFVFVKQRDGPEYHEDIFMLDSQNLLKKTEKFVKSLLCSKVKR